MQRLKFLIKKIIGIASRAVKSEESSTLLDNALDDFSKRVDEKAPSCMSNVEATLEQPDVQLQSACLKKKEPQKKSSRRKRTWLEKQRPRKKKKESSKEVPHEEFDSVSYLPTSLKILIRVVQFKVIFCKLICLERGGRNGTSTRPKSSDANQ